MRGARWPWFSFNVAILLCFHEPAVAQWQGMCPNGQWVSVPYGYECVPNQASQPQVQPPPSICPAGTSYCGVSGACCGSGTYCSKYGCTPVGAVDCGSGFCNPGQVCTSNGHCMPAGNTECGDQSCKPGYYCGSRNSCMPSGAADCGNGTSCSAGNKCTRDGRHCIPQNTVDCGSHFCAAGSTCGSGNQCIAAGASDCGNGNSCGPGEKCSWSTKSCLPQDAMDCGSYSCGAGFQCGANNKCIAKDRVDCGHGHSCEAGQACGSDYQCIARNAVDCGGGRSCPAGKACVNGGEQCLSPAEVTAQRVLKRRLDEEAASQTKEDKDAEAWLRREQARLAQQAEERRLAEQKRQEEAASQQLQKQNTTVSTIIPGRTGNPKQPEGGAQTSQSQPTQEGVPHTIIPGKTQDTSTAASGGSLANANAAPSATVGPIASAVQIAKPVTIAKAVPIGTPTDIASIWTQPTSSGLGSGASQHNYTFSPTPYGTVQVADNGKYLATTSPALAALQYGYQAPGTVTSSNLAKINASAGETAQSQPASQPVQSANLWTALQNGSGSTLSYSLGSGGGTTSTGGANFTQEAGQNVANASNLLTQFYQTNPLGKTLVKTLSAAGGPAAKAMYPEEANWFAGLGWIGETASVGTLIEQKNYGAIPANLTEFAGSKAAALAASQMFPDTTVTLAGGTVAIAPALAAGTFVASFELGQNYVAPVVAPYTGAWLYNLNPAFWTPSPTLQSPAVNAYTWSPLGTGNATQSNPFSTAVPP